MCTPGASSSRSSRSRASPYEASGSRATRSRASTSGGSRSRASTSRGPPPEGPIDNPIKAGDNVEVSINEQGFRGSWFTATVIRRCSTRAVKPRVVVEYHTLTVNDKPNAKLLREPVDLVFVRPSPPREAERRFQNAEEVDVFTDDGWWEGVITAVNEDQRTYTVFFRATKEQFEYPEAQIRLHREWVAGNWVPPLEDNPPADEDPPEDSD